MTTTFPVSHHLELPIDRIAKNPLNPRKKTDVAKFRDLVDSIRAHGVLQPIMVRSHPKQLKKTPYEIVIGERRWAGAQEAELTNIPAIVRELDDRECLELMLIENGRRLDLDPVEEAETYHRLQTDFGLTLAEIAARVSKSTTAVFQRVKLMDCVPDVRNALERGTISVSVAELIGRCVHPSQQLDALQRVEASRWEAAPSYREARELIEGEFMLRLAPVPWKLDLEELIAGAGSCTACPKRTGNQRELFADLKGKDVCLDRDCFQAKGKAARAARLEAAAEGGAEILEGEAAKKIFDRQGAVKASSGYVNLAGSAPLAQPGKRPKSIRQVLGKKHEPPITVVALPGRDQIIEVARKADVDQALKAKGVKVRRDRAPATAPSDETQRRKEARYTGAVYQARIGALVSKLETSRAPILITNEVLRALAGQVLESVWAEASDLARSRRGLKKDHNLGGSHALRGYIAEASGAKLLGLIVELLAQRHHPRTYNTGDQAFLRDVASAYNVDLKAPAGAVRTYLRAIERRRGGKKAPGQRKARRTKAPKEKKK